MTKRRSSLQKPERRGGHRFWSCLLSIPSRLTMLLQGAFISVNTEQEADRARRSTAPSPEPCPHPSAPLEETERYGPTGTTETATPGDWGCCVIESIDLTEQKLYVNSNYERELSQEYRVGAHKQSSLRCYAAINSLKQHNTWIMRMYGLFIRPTSSP
ncbi:hypothetical protein CIB48_g4050 [Xylaria polymorpha]|nr:hypothetical protein CIB48_g4050 [Xylaria polymorpha]